MKNVYVLCAASSFRNAIGHVCAFSPKTYGHHFEGMVQILSGTEIDTRGSLFSSGLTELQLISNQRAFTAI